MFRLYPGWIFEKLGYRPDNHVGWDVKLLPSLVKGFANDSAVKDEMKRSPEKVGESEEGDREEQEQEEGKEKEKEKGSGSREGLAHS